MKDMKPILFNTDMVRAILEGRKTVTRRVLKEPYYIDDEDASRASGLAIHCGTRMTDGMPYPDRPYGPGDILYVRETFFEYRGHFCYKADGKHEGLTSLGIHFKWRPSIHMPREAARIFLRVADVRVERLRDISDDGVLDEGAPDSGNARANRGYFADNLWDSTIKPTDRALYGWVADPWVWVIAFERIGREEAMKNV